ncbi:hypothetical protein [Xanthomonas hortorum]|uniref:hypothetical protein n=1 Tax=Xanthomonas hortorum TaxID=56454 RepID=UPI001592D57E|nr:hypothetical protein [Xanthomonas hortorum]
MYHMGCMFDGLSLDQLRIFVAAAEEESFSTVDKDLAEGRLVELAVQGLPLGGAQLPMWRSTAMPHPPGLRAVG